MNIEELKRDLFQALWVTGTLETHTLHASNLHPDCHAAIHRLNVLRSKYIWQGLIPLRPWQSEFKASGLNDFEQGLIQTLREYGIPPSIDPEMKIRDVPIKAMSPDNQARLAQLFEYAQQCPK